MNKEVPKELQGKKSRLISSLMRELLDWSSKDNSKVVDLKPMSTLQESEIDRRMLDFEDKYSEKKSNEENKSEEQLSQSTISGKPSPFIGSVGDLHIIRAQRKERIIRNKSWDNFSYSTIFLENRYRRALKHNKVQCDYELFDITKKISEALPMISGGSFSYNFLKDM